MNKKILNEVGEIRKLMGLLNEQPSLNTGTTDTDIPEWLQAYFDYSDITFKDVISDEFAILRHLKDHRCTSVEECYNEALNLPTDGLDENLKKRLDLITLKLGKLRTSKYTLGDLQKILPFGTGVSAENLGKLASEITLDDLQKILPFGITVTAENLGKLRDKLRSEFTLDDLQKILPFGSTVTAKNLGKLIDWMTS